MKIPDGWYAVLSSRELKPGSAIGVRRFGIDLVLWRTAGGALSVMVDRCPHRSAKLSLGRIVGENIQCPFHGFEFNANGKCELVPETKRPAPNLVIITFPVREKNGFIWLWKGSGEPDCEPPWFSELDSSWQMGESTHEWPTDITRCIENQLDYAHLPFVHRTTIGGRSDPSRQPEFILEPEAITYYMGDSKERGAGIQFRFPNIWMLTIVPGRFAQMMAFVPVDESITHLYLRNYQKFVTLPLIANLLVPIFNWQNGIILNQDKLVVLSQTPGGVELNNETLFPSDKAVAHFRKRWNEKCFD